MLNQPEKFILEKLSKKELSANTVRDLILATFLVALQKNEQMLTEKALPEDWLTLKAVEIREKASRIFASVEAPFEYPTRAQLEKCFAELEKAYNMAKLPDEVRSEFDSKRALILSKFREGF